MNNLQLLFPKLETPQKIVITSHTNPDGDAIGSSLAMYHHLSKLGHHVTAMVPNAMPDFLTWMPGATNIHYYEDKKDFCNLAIAEASFVFCLDYNSFSRLEDMGKAITASKADKILIDHHLHPEINAKYALHETSSSSTCELVWDFFVQMGAQNDLSLDVLNCLYVGLLTDTGGFSYAATPKTFRAVADINELGVDNRFMMDLVFNSYSEKRLRLLGVCLTEKMELIREFNTGIIALSHEDHTKYDIQRGDIEGIVNYILKMPEIKFAIIVSERKNEVKLSLRSRGNFSVQEFASKHFNGGGHKNASGGSTHLNFAATIQKIKDLLPKYKEELLK